MYARSQVKKCLFFSCIIFLLLLAYQLYLPRLIQEQVIVPNMKLIGSERTGDSDYMNRSITYKILYYNQPQDWKKGHDVVSFRKCPYQDCSVTTDRKQMQHCEAVIFQHNYLPERPPMKLPKQQWIFTSSESPYYTRRTVLMPKWKHVFDWSMTYRRDSDLVFGYGQIIHRHTPISRDYDTVFSEKKGEVAWIVSNCRTRSRREIYVKELQKHIKVNVFGKCGEPCEPYEYPGNDTCHQRISRDYKFYLSFENSLCVDYTSEKLYHNYLLGLPIVPIVRGSLTGREYLPAETYIDTMDFGTPKDLADALKDIGNNKTKYINMLRAKDTYSSKPSWQMYEEALCKLCKMLHYDDPSRLPLNVSHWFFANSCREPFDL